MTELSLEKVQARKLAHAYVALALAQDEAKRYVNEYATYAALNPLLMSLDVTAELLEEVLQNLYPETYSNHFQPINCSDMLM